MGGMAMPRKSYGGHFIATLRNNVARNNISTLSNNVAGYLPAGISRQSGDFMLYI
jgi:hypothetical protein